jgi:hypothetical protein
VCSRSESVQHASTLVRVRLCAIACVWSRVCDRVRVVACVRSRACGRVCAIACVWSRGCTCHRSDLLSTSKLISFSPAPIDLRSARRSG